MILSLLTITIAFIWLMVETHYMTIRLASGEIPIHDTTPIKRQPILEPCRIINVSYPIPEPIKLLAEFCYLTRIQNEMKGSKYKIDYQQTQPCRHESYQIVYIGGHSITLSAISDKLYELMAEFQKIADGKDRKPALKFAPINSFNPLCGKEWLEAHINDVIPEPTIDLSVNGNEIHFNGNYKTGCIKEFCKANK